MILVTIGSLFPFDRLIRSVDEVAAVRPNDTFFAQIGRGAYAPKHMQFSSILTAKAFDDAVKSSHLIIAHAGMGSVIVAMEAGIPIVIVPRRMELGEHTTDHQMATARWLAMKPGIFVVWDESSLNETIDTALATGSYAGEMVSEAPTNFLKRIADFIGRD